MATLGAPPAGRTSGFCQSRSSADHPPNVTACTSAGSPATSGTQRRREWCQRPDVLLPSNLPASHHRRPSCLAEHHPQIGWGSSDSPGVSLGCPASGSPLRHPGDPRPLLVRRHQARRDHYPNVTARRDERGLRRPDERQERSRHHRAQALTATTGPFGKIKIIIPNGPVVTP